MRILITGAKGRLGSRLTEQLSADHEVTPTDLDEMDFTDNTLTRDFMRDLQPELVLHVGAMTAVDEAAKNPDVAFKANGIGTKNVVLGCQEVGAEMLYVSTNEVFDGRNTDLIREYDAPNPINAYGYSKWVGEQAVRDHLTRFYIVRTSWVFAHGGRNFIHAILDRAKSGQPLRVVVNEVALPTYNDDLTEGIIKIIQTGQYGIYHLANEGRVSRWGFAREILDQAGFKATAVEKISAAEYPRPSSPPEYSILGNNTAAALGITMRPWKAALTAFLEKEGLLA